MKTKLLLLFTLCSIISFAQTNVATNGNLETWTDATTLDNWTIENNVTQYTNEAAEGISSALFSITDNTLKPKILTLVPLTSGVEYTFRYKFKYLSSNYGGSHPVSLKIIRAGSATTSSNSAFASNNDWSTRTVSFTPDQTADYDFSISLGTFDGEAFEVLIDDIEVFDANNLSVSDISNDDDFKIYPTLTDGLVYFDRNETEQDFNISVIDINGRQHKVEMDSNTIDLSTFSSGVYFINYTSKNNSITKKILKK